MTTWIHEQRLSTVYQAVLDSEARTVLDLGCGEGDLFLRLMHAPGVERLVGVDLSTEALDCLRARLAEQEKTPSAQIELIQASMIEPGPGLSGFDCAVLLETLEHLDPGRLSILETALFHKMRPASVIVTTPNADYNEFLGVPSHRFRHPDHRFEWGRRKFRSWAEGVAKRNDCSVVTRDLAGAHPFYGGVSQMAVFTKQSEAAAR
ncbi:methyltransferase domain-containing protein [Fodinicurvata sediminis]|uniref:methyltransferase domain-containing protein n=1 Tax=Fodinicurvata sediminis TaxID=1121832 RepID=UPI0003B2FEDD|nr:methyltransferase domain-containing protein [Fodinicurvata sediminis]